MSRPVNDLFMPIKAFSLPPVTKSCLMMVIKYVLLVKQKSAEVFREKKKLFNLKDGVSPLIFYADATGILRICL